MARAQASRRALLMPATAVVQATLVRQVGIDGGLPERYAVHNQGKTVAAQPGSGKNTPLNPPQNLMNLFGAECGAQQGL